LLLVWISETDILAKWNPKIRRILKKHKKDDMDDFDTEFVDFDQLLSMYIEEFRS
jgi:hypothetical protein